MITRKTILVYINLFYFFYLSMILLSAYTLYNHLIVYSLFPVTICIYLFREFIELIFLKDEEIDQMVDTINNNLKK